MTPQRVKRLPQFTQPGKDRARVCMHTISSTCIDLNSLLGQQLYVSVMKPEGSQASSNSQVRKGRRTINRQLRGIQAQCCGWRGWVEDWGYGNVTERVASKQDSEECPLVKL